MYKYNKTIDENLLDDVFESLIPKDEFAGRYLRIWNFAIDSFVIFILFAVVIFTCLILGIQLPYDYDIPTIESHIRDYSIIATIAILYYTTSEYFFKGKTIGKFFTNTRTVTLDNQIMDFGTVLSRSLCRIIPIEFFSFLSDETSGWHDRWTNTKVILDTTKEEEFPKM